MNNQTRLEAVNDMLAVIGEMPIQTLDGDLTVDAAIARDILKKKTRFVCNISFGWNTDYDYPLPRNGDNKIPLPPNSCHVEFKPECDIDPVRRGDLVWDRKNKTFTFTKDITATEIVWNLDFTDLPEAAREFITISAAREFAQKFVGDQLVVGFTAQDEQRAWAKLRNDENRSEDRNYLRNGFSQRIIGRNW